MSEPDTGAANPARGFDLFAAADEDTLCETDRYRHASSGDVDDE
jgi:hypothetical protein